MAASSAGSLRCTCQLCSQRIGRNRNAKHPRYEPRAETWLAIVQYPHERECLFAPLAGFELQSTRIEGGILVAEVRLSVNLNALTIEQVWC